MYMSEDEELRIAGIEQESFVDGPGIRFTVFTQGCSHHCPECHNPETHAFGKGTVETAESLLKMIDANPLLSGVTLSGGDPMEQAVQLLSGHYRALTRAMREEMQREEAEAEELFWREAMLNYDFERGDWKY